MIKVNSKAKVDLFITFLWIINLILNIFIDNGNARIVLFIVLVGNCIQSSLKFFKGINYEEE